MKKLYQLIFIASLYACGQSDSSLNGEEGEAADTRRQEDVFVKQGVSRVLRNDSLLNSFVPSWSVAEVMAELPGAAVRKREAIQNRHIPEQTDTLLTIGNGRSELRFYRLPDKELLQYARIKDSELSFREGLAVGMPARSLARMLPPLQ